MIESYTEENTAVSSDTRCLHLNLIKRRIDILRIIIENRAKSRVQAVRGDGFLCTVLAPKMPEQRKLCFVLIEVRSHQPATLILVHGAKDRREKAECPVAQPPRQQEHRAPVLAALGEQRCLPDDPGWGDAPSATLREPLHRMPTRETKEKPINVTAEKKIRENIPSPKCKKMKIL